MLEIDQVPDGRQLQLDALAIHPDSKILRDGMFRAHKNILELVGIGAHFVDLDRIKKLTATEILRLSAKSNENAVASFDISNDVYVNAVLSLTTTITVTTLLALFSLLLSSDAYKIMIHPIEKMKSTIEKVTAEFSCLLYLFFCCNKLIINANYLQENYSLPTAIRKPTSSP
jgi:hypothetical protein